MQSPAASAARTAVSTKARMNRHVWAVGVAILCVACDGSLVEGQTDDGGTRRRDAEVVVDGSPAADGAAPRVDGQLLQDGACPAGAVLCEDFEEGIDSEKWNVHPAEKGTVVEATTAASGSHALHVRTRIDGLPGGASLQTAMPLAAQGDHVFMRAYIRFKELDLPGWHPTFIKVVGPNLNAKEWWLYPQTSFGALRNNFALTSTGGHDEATHWKEPDDSYIEAGDSTPQSEHHLRAGEWFCLEMEFFGDRGGDGSKEYVRTFINGEEISDLGATDETWHKEPDRWSPVFPGSSWSFGLKTQKSPYDVWYDAIVISETRIGCL